MRNHEDDEEIEEWKEWTEADRERLAEKVIVGFGDSWPIVVFLLFILRHGIHVTVAEEGEKSHGRIINQ